MGPWLAIGVAALAVVAALADGESGLRTWWQMRGELAVAEERIERLRADVAFLERQVGGLEADPFEIECAIRERLKFAKPGETLVLLDPDDLANPRIP